MYYKTAAELLRLAAIGHAPFSGSEGSTVLITDSCQLMGSYIDCTKFRAFKPEYRGWDAHHIVEDQDLRRLGIATLFPRYEGQICVLIPRSAHVKRVNGVLRTQNPTNAAAVEKDLKDAYNEAYSIVGDYCGGGEKSIQQELTKIADLVLSVRPPKMERPE